MSDRRGATENGRAKRQKMEDPSSNPYLAHMYPEGGADESYSNENEYAPRMNTTSNGSSSTDGLRHLIKHSTTSVQAAKAEDGPENPFTGRNLSDKYFGILKTRRNLPVHAQRCVIHPLAYFCGKDPS